MSDNLYEKAGVNIDKGNETVQRIKNMARKMGVREIGKFSGFYPMSSSIKRPILVSSADGVGTKLKIAFMMDKHDTVGKDIVNHCIDDILVYGAQPLFFMDYIATGKLDPDTVSSLVSGILEACVENNFILLGGETAEMPGFYKEKEYDIAGFIVGVLEEGKEVDGSKIKEGDLLIGLPSTGLHTNGYSLARHILFENLKLDVHSKPQELDNSIGEELLAIHKSYLKPVSELLKEDFINGMAHITGGGFLENIPRILPEGLSVKIQNTWRIPNIFSFLCQKGKISKEESYRVFNMGIGMILFIKRENLSQVEKILNSLNEPFHLIGQVEKDKGQGKVIIE